MVNVVIIGAGLSGLICAKRLLQSVTVTGRSERNIHIHILEARERFGGRMYQESGVDMGATWAWPSHDSALLGAVKELGIRLEPQVSDGIALSHQPGMVGGGRTQQAGIDLSPSGDGSTRFENGAASIIDRLVDELKSSELITFALNQEVTAITRTSQQPLSYDVTSTSTNPSTTCDKDSHSTNTLSTPEINSLSASVVILALPPQLASSLDFSPPLPPKKLSAMQQTPTWMADTGKVAFTYERPFWREKGLSGTAFSRGGPMAQVWDASSRDDSVPVRYALSAFVFDDDLKYLKDEETLRSSPIMEELVSIFGEDAAKPSHVVFKSWQSDVYTSHPQSKQFNGQVPFGHPLVSSAVEGIIFSGTETSPHENGHMNGAVIAGYRAASEALALLG